jgi:hypothetical protein
VIVRARYKPAEPVPGELVSPDARLLALAHRTERDVESGIFRSVAQVARALGISRARASQIMRRRWATVGEQERILGAAEAGDRR